MNIDEILASLENEKTAEEVFTDNLVTNEEAEEAKEAEKPETTEETSVLNKEAEDLEESGALIAKGFFNELQKLAESEETAVEPEDAGVRILSNLYNKFCN